MPVCASPFVLQSETLEIVTSNCGARVQHLTDAKVAEIFGELEKFGVRHDDPFLRNITYRAHDGVSVLSILSLPRSLEKQLLQVIKHILGSSAKSIRWSGTTDRGKFRPNNEDAFLGMQLDHQGIRYLGKTGEALLESSDYIFAVSDGMGGASLASLQVASLSKRLPCFCRSSSAWSKSASVRIATRS